MSFITGERAAVNGMTCLRRFKVISKNLPARAVCSSSAAGQIIAVGNDDWSGVAQGYGANPPVLPGDLFTFSGAPSNGSGITGSAIVKRLEVFWNVEDADLLYHNLYFDGVSALADGGAVTDSGSPAPKTAKGLYILVGGTQTAIRTAKIEIVCANAVFNDSSTAGVTTRKRGNFLANFEYSGYTNDLWVPTTLRKSYQAIVFQTVEGGATGNWTMTYGFFDTVEIDVNIEGEKGSPGEEGRAVGVGYSASGSWSSRNAAGAIGTIISPTKTIYPAAA